jgi:ABC-type Fe3+ transport system, periplasmic component
MRIEFIKNKSIVLIFSLALLLYGCKNNKDDAISNQKADLVVYTSHRKEIYEPIIKEFEERTGIWVHIETGGTNQLLESISKDGEYTEADIIFGGGVELLETYKEYFLPHKSIEVDSIEPAFCATNYEWSPFSALPLVIVYNNKLVDKESIPKSWEDLCDKRFKGRIAYVSPEISGSCYTAFATMWHIDKNRNKNILGRFVENLDGNILKNSEDICTRVADGEYFVGVTVETNALNYVNSGENIEFVYPSDGTVSIPDGIAIIKNNNGAESNARHFIDFVLSKDVQHYMTNELNRRSVRMDIISDNSLLPLKEMELIDYSFIRIAENNNMLIELWRELFEEKIY